VTAAAAQGAPHASSGERIGAQAGLETGAVVRHLLSLEARARGRNVGYEHPVARRRCARLLLLLYVSDVGHQVARSLGLHEGRERLEVA
jgi:hypothetical protein